MDKRFSAIRATLKVATGLTFYFQDRLELAIRDTRQALAEPWIEDRDKISATNNLAYYFASVQRQGVTALTPPEQKEALGLAEEVYRQYSRWKEFPFNNPELLETYVYVRSTFARNSEERRQVRDIIDDLLTREEMRDLRDALRESLEFLDSLGDNAGSQAT